VSDQLLRDAMHRLADEAPEIDTTAMASGQTWQLARAARRRSIVAVSAAVVLVLVGGFLAVGLTVRERPTPATPPTYDVSQLAIPNRVWIPSPWTPGTDDAGPLGPLALIATAPRHDSWFHTTGDALFGVSAATGEYRFLDLPDADTDIENEGGYTLSPDGTKIGYWVVGTLSTARSPRNVVGYAVYDTETGRVFRQSVHAWNGLAPSWMTWTGDSRRLVVQFSRWERDHAGLIYGGSAGRATTTSWDFAHGALHTLSVTSEFVPTPSSGSSIVFCSTPQIQTTLDVLTGKRILTRFSGSGAVAGGLLSPDGSRIAFPEASRGNGTRTFSSGTGSYTTDVVDVATKPVEPGSAWRARALDTGSESAGIVGWLDSSRLLISVWSSTHHHSMARKRFVSFDILTGQMEGRLQIVGPHQVSPTLATDLVANPFRFGQAPRQYRDPRLLPGVTVGVTAGLLVLLGVWWLLRRERRHFMKTVGARG
jgi:hypothetical protein